MHRARTLAATLTATVAVVALAGAASGAPVSGPQQPAIAWAAVPASAAALANGEARTVTLITGDQVTVAPDGSATTVERTPGRSAIQFTTYRDNKQHLHVVPVDALPLLRAGVLDDRLFDVTALLSFGYDTRRGDLPLIVSYRGDTARAAVRSDPTAAGVTVTRDLPAVDALAVRVTAKDTATFWAGLSAGTGTGPARALRGGVSKVWLDGMRKPSLDVSVPQIGAPAAWQAGFDGSGVRVAVLDTGIDATHPDLAGKVVAQHNFTDGVEDDRDLVGHGTHVASTIAGSGAASDGRYKGVAPSAQLLDGKVCVDDECLESWIIAGMQWAAAEQHAAVANMSLGGADTPGVDPLEEAVQTLTEHYGTLFVIAAGNDGGDQWVSSPATADAALAVGAVDASDALAYFSSRGPRMGDFAIKPDITAPGVDITAANSKDGRLGQAGEPYTTLSGTSMATPHVTGSAAILAQRHPDWSAATLKSALMGSAAPNPATGVFGQGAGRVDVAAAINQTVTAGPASVSFGLQQWPHTDDQPVSQTVTYDNHGTAEVTLDLALSASGPDGAAAEAGVFTVDNQRVTIPAGGQAKVTLTADTRVGAADGNFTGYLTATAEDSGPGVRIPFAVTREREAYDLTLVHTGRDGSAPYFYSTSIYRLDTFDSYQVAGEDATPATIRLPKGRYAVFSGVFSGTEELMESTLLGQPALELTGAQTLALDARLAKPVTVTVPNASAKGAFAELAVQVPADNLPVPVGMGVLTFTGFDRAYTAQLGPDRAVDGLVARIGGTMAEVDASGSTANTPYAYQLAWITKGRMMTGLTRHLADADLATVRRDYGQQFPGSQGRTSSYGSIANVPLYVYSLSIPATLPFVRTEYHNTEPGVLWNGNFIELQPPSAAPMTSSSAREEVYRAGKKYKEMWNRAVFGPSLADPNSSAYWVTRTGDTILAVPQMFGDGAGRSGTSRTTSRHISLSRNGVTIGEADSLSGEFTVPATTGSYRLEVQAGRGAPFTLSTSNSVVWTFRSSTVAGEQPYRLPLFTVAFAPRLDAQSAAPGGQLYAVPVSVVTQPGAVTRPGKPTVQVSLDDGATWRPVPLVPSGAGWIALIPHPAAGGFVSLRASASDSAGNTVLQTIIHAYQVTGP
jgi:subtilisin family serine protease